MKYRLKGMHSQRYIVLSKRSSGYLQPNLPPKSSQYGTRRPAGFGWFRESLATLRDRPDRKRPSAAQGPRESSVRPHRSGAAWQWDASVGESGVQSIIGIAAKDGQQKRGGQLVGSEGRTRFWCAKIHVGSVSSVNRAHLSRLLRSRVSIPVRAADSVTGT